SYLLNLLFPQTPVEAIVGAIPVNLQYPQGCVDRYIANTLPGTTDCTAAFNSAIAVCMQAGGEVTYGYTELYLVTEPINATFSGAGGVPGIVIRSLGLASQDSIAGIFASHTGNSVFDCTGNDSITFRDVSIKTGSTN